MTKTDTAQAAYRPWVDHYPPGLSWDQELKLELVHEQVLAACKTHASRPALDFLGAATSYDALGETIEALSGALQKEMGVKKGTKIALLLPNCPYYVYFYYAILRAGGTIVNCNPLYSHGELKHILTDSAADILITLDLKTLFDKAEKLLDETGLGRIVVCSFPQCLPLMKNLLFRVAKRSDLAHPKSSPHREKLVFYDDLLRAPHPFTPVAIAPEDVAVQQYTGGTTGTPKGALLSHANISANLEQASLWCKTAYQAGQKQITVLPFFHIFAMTVSLNMGLVSGIELLMLPRFDLKMLLDLVARKRPELLQAVPTLIHALCASPESKSYDLKCIELCVSGGAGLPDEVRHEFIDATGGILVEGYGLTECAPVVCCSPLSGPKSGSIGQPFIQTDVRFADLDDPSKQVPPGERGELQVKGPQVMLGYANNEKANAQAFVDGWFRTGDVGYADPDGHLYLVDRIKDLIICSGFNVYPRAIENAIYKHADVDECNVIGVKDDYRGEAPVAFIKLHAGKKLDADAMRAFLSEHLSKIEMPKDFIFKDELPKTMVGKLSKKELREEYAREQDGAQ